MRATDVGKPPAGFLLVDGTVVPALTMPRADIEHLLERANLATKLEAELHGEGGWIERATVAEVEVAQLQAEKAAVLELHKPVQRYADEPDDIRCVECDWMEHPCPTWTAAGGDRS